MDSEEVIIYITKRRPTSLGADLKQSGHTLLVTGIARKSLAERHDLRIGDIITSCTNMEDGSSLELIVTKFEDQLKGLKDIQMQIIREHDSTSETNIKAKWKSPPSKMTSDEPQQTAGKTSKKLFDSSGSDSEPVRESTEPTKKPSRLERLKMWKTKNLSKKSQKEERRRNTERHRYQEKTPQSKQAYRERESERMKAKYGAMTPKTKQAYRDKEGDRMKERYEEMTPKTKQAYRDKEGDRMKERYEEMTPKTKQIYRDKEGDRMKERYDEMTPGTKGEYIQHEKENVEQARKKTTPKTKERGRHKRRTTNKLKREQMSPNSRAAFNKEQAERVKKGRRATEELLKLNTQHEEQEKNFEHCYEQFRHQILQSCSFVCVACNTSKFRHQVIRYMPERMEKNPIAKQVFGWTTELPLSGDDRRYLCKTCRDKIKKDKCPAKAVCNGMGLTTVPPELADLGPLETRLISKRFFFYKIVQRGVGAKMPKIRGSVVNVPVTFATDVQRCLPRKFGNSGILAIKLKRRLEYQSTVLYHTVRIPKIFAALHWLKENHPGYADVEIQDEEEFLAQCQQEDSDLYSQLFTTDPNAKVSGEGLEDQEGLDEDDETEENNWTGANDDMIRRDELFQDTMLIENDGPVEIAECDERNEERNKSKLDPIDIAPAEGKQPLSLFRDPDFEVLAHPNLLPDGKYGFDYKRDANLFLGQYLEARLFSADTRFSNSADFIFSMQYKLEYERLWKAYSIQMRQSKTHNEQGEPLSAGNLRTSEDFANLLKKDRGFKFLKGLRGSPPYWKNVMSNVLSMVKNFGKPTWFLTLSCHDTGWEDMLRPIYKRAHGRELTQEEIDGMSWAERCNHLRKDPVFVCRQFQHRVKEFFRLVLLNPDVAPLGKINEYFWRVEFQARGSPHIHCLLWVEGAPEINKNSPQEICDFIDRYVTCELPSEQDDKEMHDRVMALQNHRHRKTCMKGQSAKKGEECRFHFPKESCEKTFISGLEEMAVPKENTNNDNGDLNDHGLDDSSGSAEMGSKKKGTKYKSGTKLSICLRRTAEEENINQYNRQCLRAWNANMDVQYVTNHYAVIVYILSYVCKAEAEMSSLLRNAVSSLPDDSSPREYLKKAGHAFLSGREVGLLEAVYRCSSSLLLRYQTRKVTYIPTGFPEDRVRFIKPRQMLNEMDDNETEIYFPNLLERYANRPKNNKVLQDMCLAEFAAFYEHTTSKKHKNLIDIEIEKEFEDLSDGADIEDDENQKRELHAEKTNTVDDAEIGKELPKVIKTSDGAVFKKRRKRCAINYAPFKKEEEAERYYYSKALLFLPWRDEDNDLAKCKEDPEAFFKQNLATMQEKMELFEPDNIDEIEEAVQFFEQNEDCLHNVFNELHPEGMAQFAERTDTAEVDPEYAVPEFGADTAPREPDIADELCPEKPKAEFVHTELITEEEYEDMIGKLEGNDEQVAVFNQVQQWCTATIEARKTGTQQPEQLLLFVSGPGGTGKSYLLKAIRQLLQRSFAQFYGHDHEEGERKLPAREPGELVVVVAAYTGKAARNVNGQTLHSALGLTVKSGSSAMKHMTAERIQYYKNIYHNVEALMIDEVSMLSVHQMYEIHARLQTFRSEFVTLSTKVFGGIAVIAFGDLYQLPPIAEPYIFQNPRRDEIMRQALTGHLWRKHFKIMELTIIVRQKGDKHFAEILNRVRVGKHTLADIAVLRTRVFPEKECPTDCPRIYAVNKLVMEQNDRCLNALLGGNQEPTTIRAQDSFTNPEITRHKKKDGTHDGDLAKLVETKCDNGADTGGLVTTLKLTEDARIILLKNVKVSDGLCNGSMGTVRQITKRVATDNMPVCIWVEFDKEGEFVPGMKWRKEWTTNNSKLLNRLSQQPGCDLSSIPDDCVPIAPVKQEFNSPMSKKISISRTQIPLTLCYACTFHKVQGQTLNKVVVSFAGKHAAMHTNGAAYVALSRVTSLEGLYLLDFDPAVIRHSAHVDLEMQRLHYGLEQQDIDAMTTARAKDPPPQSTTVPTDATNACPPDCVIKALQLACSKPDTYSVPDFSVCFNNMIHWTNDNAEMLHQIETYFHNEINRQQSQPLTYKNRPAKDTPILIPKYKILYTQQNQRNSLFCALSILFSGTMQHERTFRALAATAWVQLSVVEHITQDSALNFKAMLLQLESFLKKKIFSHDFYFDLPHFELVYVRGKEAGLTSLFCLCCALGCSVIVLRYSMSSKTHEVYEVTPQVLYSAPRTFPRLGHLLFADHHFWAVVPSEQKQKRMATDGFWAGVFLQDATLQEVLGHDWSTNCGDWSRFGGTKCYAPSRQPRRKPEPAKASAPTTSQSSSDSEIMVMDDEDESKGAEKATTSGAQYPPVRTVRRKPLSTWPANLHRPHVQPSDNHILCDSDFDILRQLYQRGRECYEGNEMVHPGLSAEGLLEHLKPNAWIQDESFQNLMDFLKLRQEARPDQPRCCLVSTFFWPILELLMEELEEANFDAEKERLMHHLFPRVQGLPNFLDVDKVVIPINLNRNHWVSAVIDHRHHTVTVYDSLGAKSNFSSAEADVVPAIEFLLNIVQERSHLAVPLTTYNVLVDWDTPQQGNAHDCGVYTMLFMALAVADKPISGQFTRLMHMQHWRQLLAFCAFCGQNRTELLNFLD